MENFLVFIHTISILIDEKFKLTEETVINSNGVIKNEKPSKGKVQYIINLHKINGEIISLCKYEETLKIFLDSIGIIEYVLQRVDIAFNTEKSFDELYKMNFALVKCFETAIKCNSRNAYHTDGNDFKKRNIKVESRGKVLTVYDKKCESSGKSPYNTRIEFRFKNLNGTATLQETVKECYVTLNNLTQHYNRACKMHSDSLVNAYLDDTKKGRDGGVINFTEFITKYADYIYSQQTFKYLCDNIGKNPSKVLQNYTLNGKRKLKLFKKSEIENYISQLKTAMKYFSEKLL